MRRCAWSVIGAAAVTAASVLGPSAAASAATTVSCGQVITTSITLANSLANCAGDGLDVAASGITIRLAGHTISGTNTATYGIDIGGNSHVTVKNGTITGFQVGIYASNVTAGNQVDPTAAVGDVLSGVHVNRDGNGISLQGTGDTVSGSQALYDTVFGISEYGSTKTVFSQDTASHDSIGIEADGASSTATGSTQITNCTTSRDSSDGIQVIQEVNDVITGNTASHDYTGLEADQMDSTSTVTGNQASYDHNGFSVYGSGALGSSGVTGAGTSGLTLGYDTAASDNYGFYDWGNVSGYPDTLTHDVATSDNHAGIYLLGTAGAVVQDSTTTSSEVSGDGIYVDASASGTQLAGNTANSNSNDGIYVADTSAALTGNTANQNASTGIFAAPGDTDGGGNTATGNGGPQCVNLSC